MCRFGIFGEQIELSNPAYFRAYHKRKPQLFPQTHAKRILEIIFVKPCWGGGGGRGGMLPRENVEILVLYGGI